jgi:hypothetical protein
VKKISESRSIHLRANSYSLLNETQDVINPTTVGIAGARKAAQGICVARHSTSPATRANALLKIADLREAVTDRITVLDILGRAGKSASNKAALIITANESDYGLVGTAWARDITRPLRITSTLGSMRMGVNTCHENPAHSHVGGVKKTGLGRVPTRQYWIPTTQSTSAPTSTKQPTGSCAS